MPPAKPEGSCPPGEPGAELSAEELDRLESELEELLDGDLGEES